MGRPKGSRNKKTLLKEQNRTAAENLFKSTPQELEESAVVAAQQSPQQTFELPCSKEHITLYNHASEVTTKLMTHYGMNKYPDHIMEKPLSAILDALDAKEAQIAHDKAVTRMQTHLWASWASGKISGPVTINNVEKKAKKAEDLADWLEEQGQFENATKQRERAENIRNSLKDTGEHV